MKLLVTGAAGFIGSHTVDRLLERGDDVVGLDDFNDGYDPALKRRNISRAEALERFTLVEGDVRDPALVSRLLREGRFDAIVHLAARAGVRPSIQQPVLYESANIAGLLNLLDAAVRNGRPHFVFASSSSVYGLSPRLPWREDDPVDCPVSPYAVTKRAGELMCQSFQRNQGLDACCLRLFTVYGPRQRPDMAIARFFRAVLAGEPVTVYGDGSAVRDFTYVDDIVSGLLAAVDRRLSRETVNVGGARTVTLLELVEMIGRITGTSPRILFAASQPGDVPATWADNTRARELLGRVPETRLAAGLEEYHRWLTEGEGSRALPR